METSSKFILVEWTEEGKFSVVKRDQIVNQADKDKSDEELIGSQTMILWKNKSYMAVILQCGK